ncbi:hypothetical protein [Leifsonia lichenia]
MSNPTGDQSAHLEPMKAAPIAPERVGILRIPTKIRFGCLVESAAQTCDQLIDRRLAADPVPLEPAHSAQSDRCAEPVGLIRRRTGAGGGALQRFRTGPQLIRVNTDRSDHLPAKHSPYIFQTQYIERKMRRLSRTPAINDGRHCSGFRGEGLWFWSR